MRYTLRDQQKHDKKLAIVEVEGEILGKEKRFLTHEDNTAKTIEVLSQKKRDIIRDIDNEVRINEEMLTEIRRVNEQVQIVPLDRE